MGSVRKPQTAAKAEGKTAAKRHHNSTPLSSRASESKTKTGAKPWNHSHLPPKPQEKARNGRHEGRNLITWTRPRMAEKLLLHLQYECSRYKIDLPWDSIAHRLHPGSSGGAIQQHMNRLRGTLVAEGHLVPPICQKPGSRVIVDPKVRGFVRRFTEGPDTVTTRQVLFTEPMDDRKFNLPDAYDNVKISGTSKQGGGGSQKASSKTAPVKNESPDPEDGDSDGDYDPSGRAIAARRRSSRAKATRSYVEEDNDCDMDEDAYYEETPLEGKSSDFKDFKDLKNDDIKDPADYAEEDDIQYSQYEDAVLGAIDDDLEEENENEESRSGPALAHGGTNGHHAMAEPTDGPPTMATFDEHHNPFLPVNGVARQIQENGYDEGYDDEDGDMEMVDDGNYNDEDEDAEADEF